MAPKGYHELNAREVCPLKDVQGKELWLIRMPANVDPACFDGKKIKVGSKKSSGKSMGNIEAKGGKNFKLESGNASECSSFVSMFSKNGGGLVQGQGFDRMVNLVQDVAVPATKIVRELSATQVAGMFTCYAPVPQKEGLDLRQVHGQPTELGTRASKRLAAGGLPAGGAGPTPKKSKKSGAGAEESAKKKAKKAKK